MSLLQRTQLEGREHLRGLRKDEEMKPFLAVCIALVMVSLPIVVLGRKTLGNIGKLLLVLIVIVALCLAYIMTQWCRTIASSTTRYGARTRHTSRLMRDVRPLTI